MFNLYPYYIMNKLTISILSTVFAASSYGQQKLQIDHGPYLQEVTASGATFVYNSSLPSVSCIELRTDEKSASQYYFQSEHGLKNANTTFFAIRANDLKPDMNYQYRIHAKEIKKFHPYKVVWGDSIVTQWYSFHTINPKQKGAAFLLQAICTATRKN